MHMHLYLMHMHLYLLIHVHLYPQQMGAYLSARHTLDKRHATYKTCNKTSNSPSQIQDIQQDILQDMQQDMQQEIQQDIQQDILQDIQDTSYIQDIQLTFVLGNIRSSQCIHGDVPPPPISRSRRKDQPSQTGYCLPPPLC